MSTELVDIYEVKRFQRHLFAALFACLYGEGKSAAISKLANFLVPSSRFYIVLALLCLVLIAYEFTTGESFVNMINKILVLDSRIKMD